MFFVSVTVDYLYTARFFHVDGTKSSSSGQSSSLPASMSKVSTNFEKLLSGVKLAVGPNAWNPCPILKMQAKTADNEDSKSKPFAETSIMETIIIPIITEK